VGAVNVTATPATGFEALSTTAATSGAENAALIAALCGVPLIAVMEAAAPAVFVNMKLAGAVTAATVAVTINAPDVPFAVSAVEMAMPLELVIAIVVLLPVSAKIPLAPVVGAIKVTTAPPTGFCPASNTVADSGTANAPLIGAP
jgi:hypothetical protein